MLDRCNNPDAPNYKYYGSRGIFVCERWSDFKNFLSDMGERPDGYTLGRINNNYGYYKGNCQWECSSTQARNRRSTKLTIESVNKIKYLFKNGLHQKEIAKNFNIHQATVSKIITGKKWEKSDSIIKKGINIQ